MAKLIIIYDTYCGWCYGAHKALGALADSGGDVEVLHRYLFRGASAPRMVDGFGAQAAAIDARIGQLTGQEFSQAYMRNILQSPDEVLDSRLTAHAAALIVPQGAAAELALAARLQQARYVDGISALDRDHVIAALVQAGVLAQDAAAVGSPELDAKAVARGDRAAAIMARVGARGVPTALIAQALQWRVIDLAQYCANPATITRLAS